MNYHFEVEEAIKYGVNEAIFISNLRFWVIRNRANKKHFYENHTWIYNTQAAFIELFPFWTRKNIRTIINSLIKQKVIMTGNFNQLKMDKTTWYAFENEEEMLPRLAQNGQSLMTRVPGDNMPESSTNSHWPKAATPLAQSGQAIPDNKHTDNKQEQRYTDKDLVQQVEQKTENAQKTYFDQFYKLYPRHISKLAAWKAWQKIKPDKYQIIIDAVIAQNAERQQMIELGLPVPEMKFIQHPSTWLNAGGWENEVKTFDQLKGLNNAKTIQRNTIKPDVRRESVLERYRRQRAEKGLRNVPIQIIKQIG